VRSSTEPLELFGREEVERLSRSRLVPRHPYHVEQELSARLLRQVGRLPGDRAVGERTYELGPSLEELAMFVS
jgi:hypothetical protein